MPVEMLYVRLQYIRSVGQYNQDQQGEKGTWAVRTIRTHHQQSAVHSFSATKDAQHDSSKCMHACLHGDDVLQDLLRCRKCDASTAC